MAKARPQGNYRNLLRFYRFALPHWKLILLAVAGMVLYSALKFNVIILIQPAVKALQAGERAATAGATEAPLQAPEAPAPPAADTQEAPDALEEAKQDAVDRALRLPLVQRLKRWLWPGPDLKRIALLLALFLGPLVLLSHFVAVYVERRVVWRIMADVRIAVFERLSNLSLSFFARQRTGELISRLTNDINNSMTAAKILFGKIIEEPLSLMAFLAAALWASWRLTAIAAVSVPLLVFILRRYGSRIRRYGQKTLEKLADVTDSMTQVLSGMRVVKSFNMEEAEVEEFRARNEQQLKKAFKLARNRAWAEALPEYSYVLPIALILIVCDYMFRRGLLDLARMMQCTGALFLMAGPIRRTVKIFNDVQASIPGVNRVFELLDTEPAISDNPDAVELEDVREGVRFSGVHFSYGEGPILQGIDLFVPRGKTYAIVGETGAGKSTMLDLIPRFHDVQQGAVSIDGTDVRRIKRKSLMRLIAIVGQHPFLFNRPLAENIRYGKPDATDEEVTAAARAANIHEFIEGLPDGYRTLAAEKGERFSGGQRQCITIARAILRNAPILILDEATSSLDAQSEMLVQNALNNLMKDRTTLVIAHRLSTVRHADRIVVLKAGRIVEQGTHEELLQNGGEYERLYRLQFADNA